MSLIEKIQEVQDESYQKWFDRWYEQTNLEEKLIKSAQQGYIGYNIIIKKYSEDENYFNDDKRYLARRLRDDRTIKNLRSKLGNGFEIKKKIETKETTYWNIKIDKTSEYINILWGDEK